MANIAEPMMENLKQSRLSNAGVAIAPPEVQRPERQPLADAAAPVLMPQRQPLAVNKDYVEIRRSETRTPEMPTPDVQVMRQSKIAESSPEISRPSRIMDQVGGLGVSMQPTRMSGRSEMPAAGFEFERPGLDVPQPMPFRLRDKTPLLFGADPTEAIAAAKMARQSTEQSVEERRKPLGLRESVTYSQLFGQKRSGE